MLSKVEVISEFFLRALRAAKVVSEWPIHESRLACLLNHTPTGVDTSRSETRAFSSGWSSCE